MFHHRKQDFQVPLVVGTSIPQALSIPFADAISWLPPPTWAFHQCPRVLVSFALGSTAAWWVLVCPPHRPLFHWASLLLGSLIFPGLSHVLCQSHQSPIPATSSTLTLPSDHSFLLWAHPSRHQCESVHPWGLGIPLFSSLYSPSPEFIFPLLLCPHVSFPA